ncbi:MAG: Uma2 family endonuclease [Bryobacter sp.]|nr:Uma2 family endonuclease [Bryobacter sp.]
MRAAVMVSEAEYLATVYRPDREYVNGQLLERNLGEYDHANLQTAIAALVIEILSPRDTVYNVQDRIDDYLRRGVPEVWVIDPQSLRTWIYFGHEAKEARDGELHWRGTKLRLGDWRED